ncbi:MAG: hypothetical protein K5796_04385 [Lachnospiraceae bacterium]|nr:hypothetical protein [Lachnospiraceae bacterium]
MSVLTILLKILAILGIVILSILGLLLLMILIVLFVPLRYSGKGSYRNSTLKAKIKASWFLKLVRVSFEYGEEEPLSVKILWFDLLKKKEKKEKKEKKSKVVPDGVEESKTEGVKTEESQVEEPKTEELKAEEPKKVESEAVEFKAEAAGAVKAKAEISGKIDVSTSKAVGEDSDEDPSDKPDDLEDDPSDESGEDAEEDSEEKSTQRSSKYDKIKKYIELVKSDEFKESFSLCKDSLIKILKHVLPRRWNVKATLGFDNPETVGKIFEFYGIFYPMLHRHLKFDGRFDEEIIDVEGFFKGHITAVTFLAVGLKILFNRNIRKVIKMFKETKNG